MMVQFYKPRGHDGESSPPILLRYLFGEDTVMGLLVNLSVIQSAAKE